MINRLKQHIGLKLLVTVACGIILGMLFTTIFSTQQQANLVQEENESSMLKLTETVVQGITTIMLAGYADIAQDYAENLKKVPGILDIRIVRTTGLEAFRDNKTLDDVNNRRGDEEFVPREAGEISENRVMDADQIELLKAIKDQSPVSFYETQLNGTRLLTFIGPIVNQKDCHACHGSDHEIRGMIKLTTSLQAAEEAIDQNTLITIVVAATTSIFVLVAIGFIVRQISNPILDVSKSLETISAEGGDLTIELEVSGSDEVAQLSRSFNRFTEKLRSIIKSVSNSSSELTDVAEQVASLAERTNQSVSQQTSLTHQVATMSVEMAQSMKNVVAHTEEAADVAQRVHDFSIEGKTQVSISISANQKLLKRVSEAGDAMKRLNSNMQGIDNILDVVRTVAEQTNLLALNASIEAARAGEHGRGFAVVADEVRLLAKRTQVSTAEISALVEQLKLDSTLVDTSMEASQKEAEMSMAEANRSGEYLDQISESSTHIDVLNAQIVQAMHKQLDITATIDQSLSSIDKYADQSTDATRETAYRSGDLARLAESLGKLIHQFKF